MSGYVAGAGGVRLAFREYGDSKRPTVLCVHGFPDTSRVWDGVAKELAGKYHVVVYDVRGAGESDRPVRTSDYLLDKLAEDLRAVIDRVSPHEEVHLLAHDWGGIQVWHALAQGLPAKSFTSISGPDLSHAGAFMRSAPWRKRLAQTVKSYYIGVFQVRGVAEALSRTGILRRLIDKDRIERGGTIAHADVVHGVKLYRANMVRGLARPRLRQVDIPVQVIAPTQDRYVGVAMQTGVGKWVPDLRVRLVRAGHWVPAIRPALIARWAGELIDHAEGTSEMPRYGVTPIAVVTGAGSGIGRATAIRLAKAGHAVVAVDLNEQAAKETAALCGERATAYQVDVADAAAMEQLATTVERAHGVPRIVVNNAGIGVAGPLLATPVPEWERIIGVNLWGVIHGSRLFGAMMAERGAGGRIVNVASAAAYLPSATLPAYSATKAAVLALSQCLRAELRPHGIGVIAVCPGFVDTNITTSTRFVGVDAAEEQRRRQLSKKLYRRRNFTPDRAAKAITRAIRRNTPIAPVTAEARAGLWLSRLAPALVRLGGRFDVLGRGR